MKESRIINRLRKRAEGNLDTKEKQAPEFETATKDIESGKKIPEMPGAALARAETGLFAGTKKAIERAGVNSSALTILTLTTMLRMVSPESAHAEVNTNTIDTGIISVDGEEQGIFKNAAEQSPIQETSKGIVFTIENGKVNGKNIHAIVKPIEKLKGADLKKDGVMKTGSFQERMEQMKAARARNTQNNIS